MHSPVRAAQWGAYGGTVVSSYNKALFNTTAHPNAYGSKTCAQAANALPIASGLAAAAWVHTVQDIAYAAYAALAAAFVNGEVDPQRPGSRVGAMHVTTGIFGTDAVLRSLSVAGRNDLALEAVRSTSYPSYATMAASTANATTLWETWSGAVAGPDADPEGASRNHIMFGAVVPWLMNNIVGLSHRNVVNMPNSVGFQSMTCYSDPYSLYGPYVRPSGDAPASGA